MKGATDLRSIALPRGWLTIALAALMFGVVSMPAAEASAVIITDAMFLYNDGNIPTPLEPSTGQAWTDVQNAEDSGTCPTSCVYVTNLHTSATGNITYNGLYDYQQYDRVGCTGGTCNTSSNWGTLSLHLTCGAGFSLNTQRVGTGTNPTQYTAWCQQSLPVAGQPPPKGCLTCFGNPIYAANGQKLQAETDYSVLPGLDYVRTYRSSFGVTSAITSTAFVDNSQSAVQLNGCYPSYYQANGANVPYCFPYFSPGLSSYQLVTPDGQYIQFTGPNNAVTQASDINDRVVQIVVGGVTEWQVTREDNSVEIYNLAGSLLQKTLPGGRVLTYTYSTSSTPTTVAPFPGLMLTESDAFGHTLSWTYDSVGHVNQMTDPAGGVYQYTYDAVGNLNGVTYPDSTSKSYPFNESAYTGGTNLPNAMTGLVDEASKRYATFSYNSSGKAINTQHAGGVESYSFTFNTPVVVTDPLGSSRNYWFASSASYINDWYQYLPGGSVYQYENHDSHGNVSQFTDYKGNVTTYSFDLTRNLETSRVEASGTAQARTITSQWNSVWRLPAKQARPLRITTYAYDGDTGVSCGGVAGTLCSKTVAETTDANGSQGFSATLTGASRTWSYTYDSYGRMLTAKGPRTDLNSTTTYTYYTCTTGYQCGQLHTVTDPVGNVTTYNTYNGHGQPLTLTDPNGVVTTLTYDARTRLTSRQVGSDTTTFSYYPIGLLKKVTLPDSSYVLYTYDDAHRLTQISDGASNSIQYTLDNMGNRTAEKTYDPSSVLHRTHTRAYNALNQLYQDINAAGTSAVTTTYGYDNDGNQTTINAPVSRNTTNAYDALNRLKQITDPSSGNTFLSYDGNDDLASVKDPRSLTTSYTYNGFGDLKQQVSPDTGTTTNAYDSGGNLATSTDARSAVSTYTYDAANRVTSIAYSNGGTTDQTITFGYDSGTNGKGRLTSASDANHSLSWTYDGLGRVTGKGLTIGSINASVGYGYTNADLTSIVTPSGQSVSYGFNSNHQVTSISVNGTTVVSGVTYEPFGGVNGWTWGDSTTTSRTFNGDGLISQIVTAGVTLGYSFDNANRITGISDSSNSALTWSYGYDSLDRLTSGTTSSITDGWTYDSNGNRLTQTGTTAITFSVASASNQLTATTGGLTRSYTYDAAGHTSAYGSYTFTYNDRGRMSSTSASSTNYLYNALGQMIEKSGTLGTTIFMQDEAGHLLGEYDGSGNLVQETLWLGDIPVATLRPNGSGGVNIYYLHTDHLNSPRKVSQPSTGTLAWRLDSDPFGTVAPNQNPGGLGTFTYNPRFPGQIYMAETGLNQNVNRDYDPLTGTYLESDPMGLRAGINTYAYVRSQPIFLVDSTGLEIDPKQTCIEGLGIGCKGQQNNPDVPGTPARPRKPKLPDKDYCAKHSINAQDCITCCTGIAARAPALQFDWQSQCNAECAFQFTGCPKRPKDPVAITTDPVAMPASLASF